MRICLASNNPHKIKEINSLIPSGISILSLEDIGCSEDLEETQETIEGNSLQKAQYVYDNFNIACIADDTGLEVEALNGAPGVYSARYAGPERNSQNNTKLLLENLMDQENRSARFKTVITFIQNEKVIQFEGIVNGSIISAPRGDQGFGYDPVFLPKGYEQTFGEMEEIEKNTISHRGIATQKLIHHIRDNYE